MCCGNRRNCAVCKYYSEKRCCKIKFMKERRKENGLFSSSSPSVSSQRILYTPSGFARTTLLYLQETGSLHALSAHTSHREHLASYLVFLVTSGSGELKFNGKTYQLQAGDCVFIDCRKPYSHATSTDLWTLQWCHFYGHTMPEVYKNIRNGEDSLCFIRKRFRS